VKIDATVACRYVEYRWNPARASASMTAIGEGRLAARSGAVLARSQRTP
jgi:hypothetical protein